MTPLKATTLLPLPHQNCSFAMRTMQLAEMHSAWVMSRIWGNYIHIYMYTHMDMWACTCTCKYIVFRYICLTYALVTPRTMSELDEQLAAMKSAWVMSRVGCNRVYMYIHICVYVYIYICIHIYIHICICRCIYIYIYMYVHMYIHTCIFFRMSTCISFFLSLSLQSINHVTPHDRTWRAAGYKETQSAGEWSRTAPEAR